MRARILLADVHKLFRQAIRSLLADLPGAQVVAETADGFATLAMVDEMRPDVVLMDVSIPGLDGLVVTGEIARNYPDTAVVGLSADTSETRVAQMLAAGASGYLVKDCTFEELRNAITAALAGERYLGASLAKAAIRQQLAEIESGDNPVLSPREREVLAFIAQGMSTKQIARQLRRSVKTIETHRSRIAGKLKTASVAKMTKYAIRQGIISL